MTILSSQQSNHTYGDVILEYHPHLIAPAPDLREQACAAFAPLSAARHFTFPARLTTEERIMAYEISKVDVWTGTIEDRAGSLAAKLAPLADAGVDLSFLIARRDLHKPGSGVVYLGGISGDKATKAAAAAGLTKASDMAGLRVEGTNKPGDCQRVAGTLAGAGLNLRGVSASVIGNKYVLILAFDNQADADKAAQLLRGK